MDPVLGIIGAFLLALTVAVLVYTHQHNKNPTAQKISWDAASAVVAALAAIGGALLAAGLAVGGTIGADEGGKGAVPTMTITATPTPPLPAEVSFEKPQDGDTFPTCGTATGKATLVADQVVVVGEREEGDARWYFEPDVRYDGRRTAWNVHLQLGAADDQKKEVKFDVIALVMSKQIADYLAFTQTEKNEFGDVLTYWSSPDLPPAGVDGQRQIGVTRVPDAQGVDLLCASLGKRCLPPGIVGMF